MGKLMRAFDWSTTAVGPIESWPQSLRTAVSIVINSAFPMFIWWGKDELTNFYNDAYIQVLGDKHPAALGMSGRDSWSEIWDDIGPLADKVFKTGKPVYLKDLPLTMNRREYAEQTYFTFSYSPVRDETGKIAGMYCACIEMTKQLKTEMELRLEQQNLQAIFLQAPAAIVLLEGTEHIFLLANTFYQKLFNRTAKQLIGHTVKEVYPEIEEQGYIALFDQVYQSGKPFVVSELPAAFNRNSDGVLKKGYFSFVVHPIKNQTGKTEKLMLHIVEMTDQVLARKKAEESREQLQQQLRLTMTLTDNASACLFMVDSNGLVTYMNPAAERVTGYSSKEALGNPMHSLVHHSRPDGAPYLEADCPLVDTYKNGNPSPEHEDIFFRKDGTKFPALIIGTPLPHPEGVKDTVVEFRDITEQKMAEKELREGQAKEQRMKLLTEQRDALAQINKTKDEFIAMASHQLRTPATAVKQYIGIILDGLLGPIDQLQAHNLRIAYDSNERQLIIINDLLKTAQIDSDKYQISRKRHDIVTILKAAIADSKPTYDIKRQSIVLTSPGDTLQTAVDNTEMKLVFMNLLENASKYSYPDTQVTISVGRKYKTVTIAVTDEGVGINKENAQRIFDKFTRIDNELSDTVTGTGLGLYLVRQIVELHGGAVNLKSEPDKGSTFSIKLPLYE